MLCRTVLIAAAWLIGCLASASAQEVSGITIVEHGIYTADITSTERKPGGIGHNTLTNICHVVTTSVIPAKMGLMFGFRYRVEGTPQGLVTNLTRVTRFPVPLRPPDAVRPVQDSEYPINVRVGAVSYIGYGFDHAWELQTGLWSMELWHGERKLAERSFTIVEGGGESVPQSSNTNCFQLSML